MSPDNVTQQYHPTMSPSDIQGHYGDTHEPTRLHITPNGAEESEQRKVSRESDSMSFYGHQYIVLYT